MIRSILQQATGEAEVEINGKIYYTFIVNSGSKELRLIIGESDLTFAPIELDIENSIIK